MKIVRGTKGFTLVEIMIVVAIIGLLAAIAVPNFVQARTTARKNACINNLRLIDAAKEQWAMDTNQASGATPAAADVNPYLKGGTAVVWCPEDTTKTFAASYDLTSLGVPSACKINAATHKVS